MRRGQDRGRTRRGQGSQRPWQARFTIWLSRRGDCNSLWYEKQPSVSRGAMVPRQGHPSGLAVWYICHPGARAPAGLTSAICIHSLQQPLLLESTGPTGCSGGRGENLLRPMGPSPAPPSSWCPSKAGVYLTSPEDKALTLEGYKASDRYHSLILYSGKHWGSS